MRVDYASIFPMISHIASLLAGTSVGRHVGAITHLYLTQQKDFHVLRDIRRCMKQLVLVWGPILPPKNGTFREEWKWFGRVRTLSEFTLARLRHAGQVSVTTGYNIITCTHCRASKDWLWLLTYSSQCPRSTNSAS